MQLVMYLGNDFIDSVSVNSQQLSVPGYMGRLKRQLLSEHSFLLADTSLNPEFLVVDTLHPPANNSEQKFAS